MIMTTGSLRQCLASLALTICAAATTSAVAAERVNVIKVSPAAGTDATHRLQAAIDSAATLAGEPVIIALEPGEYDISRAEASRHLYHISNTASVNENPDQTNI